MAVGIVQENVLVLVKAIVMVHAEEHVKLLAQEVAKEVILQEIQIPHVVMVAVIAVQAVVVELATAHVRGHVVDILSIRLTTKN